jgi:hypothetical protein
VGSDISSAIKKIRGAILPVATLIGAQLKYNPSDGDMITAPIVATATRPRTFLFSLSGLGALPPGPVDGVPVMTALSSRPLQRLAGDGEYSECCLMTWSLVKS